MPDFPSRAGTAGTSWRLAAMRQRNQLLLAGLALALACTNVALTWGHIGLIWGDMGVWLHDAERFGRGELPYRDYHWPYPPVSMWLVGSAGRLLGTDAAVFWAVSAGMFLGIVYLFSRYTALLIPTAGAFPIVLAGILLATAVEDRAAMGMYTPAAPLGFLFLQLGVLSTIRLLEDGEHGCAALGGALAALMILTKHDFWIPALYLLAASLFLLRQTRRKNWRSLAATMLGTFALGICAGALVIVLTAGPEGLAGILGGGGQVTVTRGRAMPSGQRLTLEVLLLSLYGAAVFAIAGMGNGLKRLKWPALLLGLAVLCVAFFLFMESRSTGGLHSALLSLKQGTHAHLLPLFLPILAMGLTVLNWKRAPHPQRIAALLLLGLCVTARTRRLFEYTEWFHFLLELPVYAYLLQMFFPKPAAGVQRALRVACGLLVLAGVYSYWNLGVGPLTRRGRLVEQPTVRGTIYLEPEHVAPFRAIQAALDRDDPGRSWPLLALGHTGGFNYFYGRSNPTPLTLGFWLSNFSAAAVVENLQRGPRPMFLLENRGFLGSNEMPSSRLNLLSWRLQQVPYPPTAFDWKLFQELAVGCEVAERYEKSRPHLVLYRCTGQGPAESKKP